MNKNTFNVRGLLVLMLVPMMASCFSKSGPFELEEEGDMEITVGIDTIGIPAEEIQQVVDNTLAILERRLSQMDYDRYFIQQVDNQPSIMVRVKGVSDRDQLRKNLVSQANLEFWETFATGEVVPYLLKLDSLFSTNHQTMEPFSKQPDDNGSLEFQINQMMESQSTDSEDPQHQLTNKLMVYGGMLACIGRTKASDVSEVDSIIHSEEAQQCLPSDLKLLWGAQPVSDYESEDKFYELYAIKVTDPNGKAPISGDCVIKAEAENTQWGPAITIEMNTEGAHRWAEMTRKNIGDAIAIVMDNLVYSAPRVNDEITGGYSQIAGNFTPEEMNTLAAILNSGKMPVRLFIAKEQCYESSK